MDLVGHDRQRAYLERLLGRKSYQHFFIFHGPESVGKRSIAETFANALLTGSSTITWQKEPHITRHADFLLVAPHKETKKGKTVSRGIGVAHVRSACTSLTRTTASGARVLLVDDAHEMTPTAQNAFLKTIEEPPLGTYIICITSDIERLLPTVRSRATEISFGLVPQSVLATVVGVEDDVIALAQGRPGRLMRIKEDSGYRLETEEALSLLRELRTMTFAQRMEQADIFAKDQEKFFHHVEVWINRVYEVAHIQKQFSVLKIAQRMEQARFLLSHTNTNKKLIIEDLFVRL